jgi:integrase
VEEGGVEALLEKPRRGPNLKNRVDLETEQAVVDYAVEYPAYGQVRVSNELRKRSVFVSASGVRSIWLRHDLANFKQRLKALETKVANDGIVLTEAQVQALEKKKLDDEAWGEIDTAHPGYLGSQDTFYVGTMKGVGRIYQQTYVDTYAKVAHAKLYKTKTPITAADMLNDKVLPFYEQHDLPVLRILTDRGTALTTSTETLPSETRLAMSLLSHTGQRRSDVVKMGRQHVKDGWMDVTQQKTGKKLSIPVVDELKAVLDAGPTGDLTYLVTQYGKPFTSNGFGNWFRRQCDAAGLPQCSAHGLRKAAASGLAEKGCSTHEIMSITGHDSLQEVQRYTKAAEQKQLAERVRFRIDGQK